MAANETPEALRGPFLSRRAPRAQLLIEAAVLYVAVPLALWAFREHVKYFVVPTIILGAVPVWWVLRRDPAFDRACLLRLEPVRSALPRILQRFAIASVLLTAGILVFMPQALLAFPRARPGWWAVVMVAYPLLSVFPQELIFRAFLSHRYRAFLGGRTRFLAVNAVTFGLAHLFFANWFAPLICTAGGWILADSWRRSEPRSLLVPCLEHALYGQFLFTIGYGRLLYGGGI